MSPTGTLSLLSSLYHPFRRATWGVVMGVAALTAAGCGEGTRATPPSTPSGEGSATNELTVEMVKPLLVEAAAVPREAFEAVATSEAPMVPGDARFTWLVMQIPLDRDEPQQEEFRFLNPLPRPSDIAKVLDMGNQASAIQLSYITECQVKSDGDIATGEVAFRNSQYEGRAEFTARRIDGKWQVVEFRLPRHGMRSSLQSDGTWKLDKAEN